MVEVVVAVKSCPRFVMQVRLGRCDRGKAQFFKRLLEAAVKLNLVMQPAWNPTKAGVPFDSTKFLEAPRYTRYLGVEAHCRIPWPNSHIPCTDDVLA